MPKGISLNNRRRRMVYSHWLILLTLVGENTNEQSKPHGYQEKGYLMGSGFLAVNFNERETTSPEDP